MTASLEGRRAVVTGAAGGLGRAYARALAERGASVAVCDIDPSVAAVADELNSEGRTAWAAVADVASADDMKRFVDGAAERLGGLDTVIANAGIAVMTNPVSDPWEKAVKDYDEILGVNLRGEYLVGRAAIPWLIRAGGGDIVNITTDHIHTCGWPVALDHADAPDCPYATQPRAPWGGPSLDLYDVSKWGLNGMTNNWARVLRPHNIRVNSFGMGPTDTAMYRGHLGDRPPSPLMMTPESVAGVLIELLEEGPEGRTGDSVQVWAGHPCVLPPPVSHLPKVP